MKPLYPIHDEPNNQSTICSPLGRNTLSATNKTRNKETGRPKLEDCFEFSDG